MGEDVMVIDGSFGEGGGQILRTSVALAAALWTRTGRAPGEALKVVNIRARRAKGGLRPQHLLAVRAAAAVCGGELEGDAEGSSALLFRPGRPVAGQYDFDIGTAGSCPLVFQTLLPILLTAEGDSQVVIAGGTHNPMAPCFEYLRDVFATLASAAGAPLAVEIERMGFYPAGGGRLRCQVRGLGGANLSPVRLLSRGPLKRVEGLSAASASLPEHIVQRQANQASARLRAEGIPCDIRQVRLPTDSPGTVLFLRAVFARSLAGFFALGRIGTPAERVADEAVDQLSGFLARDGAVDPHAADQLVTLLALCPGRSELTTTCVTDHLLTNAQVVRLLSGREVEVVGDLGSPGKVVIGQTNAPRHT